MAVVQVGSTYRRFLAWSTDEKPMDVADGATLKSVDTGEEWEFFDGMWVLKLETAQLPARVLAAI